MSKTVKFEYIYADCPGKSNHMFHMDGDDYDYDCHDTCIIWDHIAFYSVPSGLSDEQLDRLDEGDYQDAVKIGELFGCLILCKQILAEGEDPWEICDDENGDLEYTISALSDEEGPLNIDSGDPEQDVYYIHKFNMEPGYDDQKLKSRILKELPNLIFTFFHVVPELLAFYPSPLEFTPDPAKKARNRALMNIAMQKIDSAMSTIVEKEPQNQDEKLIIEFGKAYPLSQDEHNIIMRRRNSGSSYPEEAKDKKEYSFYEANGFEEVGDSRLLYKYVGQD